MRSVKACFDGQSKLWHSRLLKQPLRVMRPKHIRMLRPLCCLLTGFLLALLLLTESFAANTEEEAYTIAVGLYNDGLIDLARDQFRQFLTQFPQSQQAPFVQFLLGECDYRQKKYDAAVQEYQRGLSNYPGNIYSDQMLYKTGRAYFLRKD